MFDLLREIAQTLRNNRLRTVLTGLSVAWGIFMLIVLLGVARGVKNSFEQRSAQQAHDVITFWNGYTNKPWQGYKDGRRIQMKDTDGNAIMRDNSFAVDATPKASIDTAKIATELDVVSSGLDAVYPKEAETESYELIAGRFINHPDIEYSRRTLVLCERDARRLFKNTDDALGATVRSLGLAWTVVGIYKHDWKRDNFIPYTTYKAITGGDDKVYQLDVTLRGIDSEEAGEAAEDALRLTMSKQHSFDPTDRSALWSWNRLSSNMSIRKSLTIFEIALWVIGFFTLLSGIVGVSNIMFVSVRERTHEIGIRRAIGAKPRSVLIQILTESVAMTALFGYVGVFFGMLVLEGIAMLTAGANDLVNPTVDITIAVKVTIALIIAGSMAGLFPALKAIKVKPVEALRDE